MALVALYRPGPAEQRPAHRVRRAQARPAQGDVPAPRPRATILADTYGVMVYQEQVMQIAVRMAGYSMGEADTLRKAMGKKNRERADAAPGEVRRRARSSRGYPQKLAEEHVRPDRAVRRLRVQRLARVRVRAASPTRPRT